MATKKKSNFRGKVGSDAKRQQSAAKSYGHLLLPKGVSVWSPEPGSKNVLLDMLPYIVTSKNHPDRNQEAGIAVEGSQWYKRPYSVHRNIGANNDTVVCLQSIGKKCPICIKRAEMFKSDADPEEIKLLNSSKRNLYAVIPLKSKKHEEKVHVFDISQYNFQDLLNEELEENEEHEIFPDLEEGETLKIRFGSKTIGKGKPFAETSKIEFVEREEAYSEDILDEVPSLDDMLHVLTYKELEAKFNENEEEEDAGDLEEDDDEDDTPKRSKKTLKKKSVAKDEDDDEEEEDDDEDEEDEEEEAPVKKKVVGKKPAKKVAEEEDDDDDEEEEEDDDEEEEEDEKPVRSAKKKSPVRRR